MAEHGERDDSLLVSGFMRGLKVITTFGEGAARQSLSDVAR